MKGQIQGTTIVIIIVVAIAALFFFATGGGGTAGIGPAVENWQAEYTTAVQSAGIEPQYFAHDTVINTNDEMSNLAREISAKSINTKDAIKNTMDWVYNNVEYTRKTYAQECFSESSVDVYKKGLGDCVSMTKTVVSLLRSQGIAARPAGGCISSSFSCSVLFSVHPERQPRFEAVDPNDPKKRGGLHEWVEIWVPNEGWIIGEATSGQLFPKTCSSYNYHDYNSDSMGMCVITDNTFVNLCGRF